MLVIAVCSLALVAFAAGYDFEDPFYNRMLVTELEDIEDGLEYSGTQHSSRHRRQIDEDYDGKYHRRHHHHHHHHDDDHHHHRRHHHHHHHHRRHHDDDYHHDRHRIARYHQEDDCQKKPFSQCCDIDIMKHHRFQNFENRQECFAQVYGEKGGYRATSNAFKCEDPQKRQRDMTCFVQCLAFKNNVVDSDGDIIETQFAAFVKDHAKGHWIQPYLDSIISKCLSAAKNATVLHEGFGSKMDSCNPAGIKGAYCFLTELQMYCPNERITDYERCEKFRATVNQKFNNEV